MSVQERFEDPGEFTVPLSERTSKRVRRQLADKIKGGGLDWLVVLPQGGTKPSEFSNTDFLGAARYAGPIFAMDFEDEPFELWGRGMTAALGLSNHGPIIADPRDFTAATLSTVLSNYANGGIIPAGLTQGTITDTGQTWDISIPIGTKAIDAFRTTMDTFGAHFRINPNGTVDAGPDDTNEVFTMNESGGTRLPVAIPKSWGSDPMRLSIEARNFRANFTSEDNVDSVVIIEEDYDGVTSATASKSRGVARYSINNVTINWVKTFDRPANEADSLDGFMTRQLEEWSIENRIDIDLNQWEILQGSLQVGGNIWVFAPEWGVYDATNEITHRGITMNPELRRVTFGEWQFTEGMGVYVWPGGSATTTADVIDISPFMDWEAHV